MYLLYLQHSLRLFPYYLNLEGNTYALLLVNFRCTGTTTQYSGNCNSTHDGCSDDECRAYCDENKSCNFYARWDSGHCEVYDECPVTMPEGNSQIRLWLKNVVKGKTITRMIGSLNYNRVFFLNFHNKSYGRDDNTDYIYFDIDYSRFGDSEDNFEDNYNKCNDNDDL